MDGSVLEIVRNLREVQHLEEKAVYQRRCQEVTEMRIEKSELRSRHAEEMQRNMMRPHVVKHLRDNQEAVS